DPPIYFLNYTKSESLFNLYTFYSRPSFLFTHKENGNSGKELVEKYTDWFWDQIEDYFMGKLPEEVETELFQKKSRADE
uniref:hypothetical protein n=1 Tax=Limosilactobacillus fermentum TaxID=1613 RepID=UPI003005F196